MHLISIIVPSPIGEWLAVADAVPTADTSADSYVGAVRMCAFVSREHPRTDALTRLSTQEAAALSGAADETHPVARALTDYFAGDVRALDAIACEQPGTPFQQATWAAMRGIPAGGTASYAQLAAASGRPAAVRAAASVCAVNRIPLFIPCHRVLRSDGSTGNYYFGAGVKRWLLAHESDSRR